MIPACTAPRHAADRRFGAPRLTTALLISVLGFAGCHSPTRGPENGTIGIAMRDGVELATRLYVPRRAAPPFSVILLRTPYNKDWLEGYGRYYRDAGYVVAIQDVRGRWASPGRWEPFVHEGADGFDTIEWLGTQEWSTGKVAMVGGSYSGTAQFAAAALHPPHLVTIVPTVAPAMPFDNIPREGGALAMGWALRWATIMENARTGRELQAMLQRSVTDDWSGPLGDLPVIDLDRSLVGREVTYFRNWARHPPEDPYWNAFAYLPALETVNIPVFLQTGWFDPGTRGAREAFDHLIRGGNRHVRFLVGPWAHGDQGTRRLNGIDMGAAAERDLMAEYLGWFDFWLKSDGADAPDAPGVELFLMGSNRWLTGEQYPLPETTVRALYLAGPDRPGGTGRLEWQAPQTVDASDTFVYHPDQPTPSFHAALKRGGLAAYRERIEHGDDVLIYETDPLEGPLGIAGPLHMNLFAASSARDTDWTATLYGLTPTGEIRVLGLTFGIQRARYRESMTAPTFLDPGTVYPFVIDLGHTAVTLQAGERLRLEIASAAFPEYSRNLNTGGDNETDTHWVEARQRVYRSSVHPSHVVVPILESAGIVR